MFVPIVTFGSGSCDRRCGIPRAAAPRFIAASVVIALGVLTVAFMQTGQGVLPADGAVAVAVGAVLIGALLVNRVARVPGLPLACAALTSLVLLAGIAFGLTGLMAPHTLGALLFVPILVATAATTRAAGILSTFIVVGACVLASAFPSAPPS